MKIDPQRDLLALIDIQPTFMPGGELPVPGGEAVVPVANTLLENHFAHAIATQDWHPPGHHSFASTHPGRAPYDQIDMPYGPQILWPDHAIQGTPGAALHPALHSNRIELILRKGFRPEIDSYSAFFENDRRTPTGLAGTLRERGFTRLFFAGLATDFCVAYSAEDAIRLGFQAIILDNACRAIALPSPDGATTLTTARARLTAQGALFLPTTALRS